MKIKYKIYEYDEDFWFFGTHPDQVGYVVEYHREIYTNSYTTKDRKIEHKILKRLKYEN